MSPRSGPAWHGWSGLNKPAEICFVPSTESLTPIINILINGQRVGYLLKRPHYCDRGRWQFICDLPYIERDVDGFPRYYMDETRAKLEIIAWLNWRLWERTVI